MACMGRTFAAAAASLHATVFCFYHRDFLKALPFGHELQVSRYVTLYSESKMIA